MITHLDVGMDEWLGLTWDDRRRLGDWIDGIVGTDKYVYGVELVGEGAVRVEIYVDAEGNPAQRPKDIPIDRVTGDVATRFFDYAAAEPPPIWPGLP